MNTGSYTIYISGLPAIDENELEVGKIAANARFDLGKKLKTAGYNYKDLLSRRPWLRDMLKHAADSHAFIFPPMVFPETSPNAHAEAAQRWFEFFSLVTGVHIGSEQNFGAHGASKPCILMDPNEADLSMINLLEDLHHKDMFSSEVKEVVRVIEPDRTTQRGTEAYYHALNQGAVATLGQFFKNKEGKKKDTVSADTVYKSYRKPGTRHPFGVALFGSATTNQSAYTAPVEALTKAIAERGWRLVTGAGCKGCMGAADRGFEAGKEFFRLHYPRAPFQPAHIGISTQEILRLEGPPKSLHPNTMASDPNNHNQLIVVNNIYDRMKVIIKGQKSPIPEQRTQDTVRVIFVAPGGTGTLHEFATMMQLATNGDMMGNRKIILLNFPSHLNPAEGFWDLLIGTAKKLGFDKYFDVAKTPEEAIDKADKVYGEWFNRQDIEMRSMILPLPRINEPTPVHITGVQIPAGFSIR